MTFSALRYLLLAAALLGGVLGGISADRLVVGFPAWRRLGAVAWAEYSRRADLGNGLILYPAVAVGHAVLSILVAMALSRSACVSARPAAYAAAAFAIVGLLATIRAAPFMLSLRQPGGDAAQAERAFSGFVFWSVPRAMAQLLAFVANLWTLTQLWPTTPGGPGV